MHSFRMTLKIRAENIADAEELINDYSGKETDIEILATVWEHKHYDTDND